MPHFYFDLYEQDVCAFNDDVGLELADFKSAQMEAAAAIIDAARYGFTGCVNRKIVLAVREEDGSVIYEATMNISFDHFDKPPPCLARTAEAAVEHRLH